MINARKTIFFRILASSLIIGIILMLSVAAFVSVWQSEKKHCRSTLESAADSISREVVIRMEDNLSVLQLAAGTLLDGGENNSPESAVEHINKYLDMTIFSRLDIICPDNSIVLHNGLRFRGEDIVSFDEIAASDSRISRRTTDYLTGRETIFVYNPVVSDGETVTIISGVIDCSTLLRYFSPTVYNGMADCLLVDIADGNALMNTMHDELHNLYELGSVHVLDGYDSTDLIESIRNAESGYIAYRSELHGGNHHMYYTPVKGCNWELLVVVDEELAFADLASLRSSLTAFALFECLIIIVFVILNLISVNQILRNKNIAEEQLHKSNILIECVTELSSSPDIDVSINNLLAIVNRYFGGDRTYIFDVDYKHGTTSNLYEFAAEGVTKEIDNLQNVPISSITTWLEEFNRTGIFYISDIEQDVVRSSNTYKILAAQGIHSLIAVPLMRADTVIGFMGVDNPTSNYNDLTLLSSVQFFITEAIERRATHDELTKMSYTDTLTRLHNRNRFNRVCDEYIRYPRSRVGVAFFDLDGLKEMNDTYGHDAGDRLIVSAADNIRSLFSGNAYRIGGDEFAVIVSDIDEEDFSVQVDKVRRLMQKNNISTAIGVSWHENCPNISRQLKEADERMYVEKAEHRRLRAEKKKSD